MVSTEAYNPKTRAELYALIRYACRNMAKRLQPDLREDLIHTVACAVFTALERGSIRNPQCLLAYIQRACKFSVLNYWREARRQPQALPFLVDDLYPDRRTDFNPDDALAAKLKTSALKSGLQALNEQDREIIVRFYLIGQDQDLIQQALGIGKKKFQLTKSRALAKLRNLVARELNGAPRQRLQALAAAA